MEIPTNKTIAALARVHLPVGKVLTLRHSWKSVKTIAPNQRLYQSRHAIWWYGVPMALLSFLENNDLSGKQVYLFCSHGTGGLASSVDIIMEALPDGKISDNIFDCYEEEAADSEEEILKWLSDLGY